MIYAVDNIVFPISFHHFPLLLLLRLNSLWSHSGPMTVVFEMVGLALRHILAPICEIVKIWFYSFVLQSPIHGKRNEERYIFNLLLFLFILKNLFALTRIRLERLRSMAIFILLSNHTRQKERRPLRMFWFKIKDSNHSVNDKTSSFHHFTS